MSASYTALVDVIAGEIAAGRLKAGERLPPQRQFAYEKGIAASTAARVYAELLRRGLVVGEVGRGTFVAGQAPLPPLRLEPFDGRIDLEFNFPTLPDQAALMANSLAAWQQPEAFGAAARARHPAPPGRGRTDQRQLLRKRSLAAAGGGFSVCRQRPAVDRGGRLGAGAGRRTPCSGGA